MTRIAERVRCIICTHVTTDYRTEGCSHTGCPHRDTTPNDQLHRACKLYETGVVAPLHRRVMRLVDEHYNQDNDQ